MKERVRVSDIAAAHVAGSPASDGEGLLAVGLPILLSAALYLGGLLRQRPSSRAWAFCTGLAVLAASLLPPLDRWSATSFAFHMTQHELLMLIAAPLIVLGRPLPYFLWSLPESWRQGVDRFVSHGVVQGIWSV